jgi:hypothetical protein
LYVLCLMKDGRWEEQKKKTVVVGSESTSTVIPIYSI